MFGRTRKRIDKAIKEAQNKKTEDVTVDETPKQEESKSKETQRVFTIPNSNAAVRLARSFKRCADWDWDEGHKNVIVTFNDNADLSDIHIFESFIDHTDVSGLEEIVLNLKEHINEHGDCWDFYFDVDRNVKAYLKTDKLEIDITANYLNGFSDDENDVFYIKIKSLTQDKTISIDKDRVSSFIREELYNTLIIAECKREELYNSIAKDVKDLCGK